MGTYEELLWSLVVPGYLGFKTSFFQSKFFFSFHQSSFMDIQGYDFKCPIYMGICCASLGLLGFLEFLISE